MNTESDDAQPPLETADQLGQSDVVAVTEQVAGDVCSRCLRTLPIDSPDQLCPYCLLAADLADPDSFSTEPARRGGAFEPPTASELQPFFPSLEVVSLIGHGGMGAVYRAHQRSLDRDVALKILPPEIAATEGFVQRFTREAHALARLGHPNIVAVYDHGTSGPYAYLVMELVAGVNLRDLMAGERLPPAEAFRIVPQLCDALQFAHSRGVVHRDIKPENILIDETGRVIITDFGLAKLVESGEDLGRTATRQVMGTVHYMAPEQIEHPKEVDHRADLYSLGVVFYELLTGELPLGRFSPPSEKAGTSRGVDKVVLKSLEKEPQRRYSSAQQVRSDLDRGQGFTSGRAHAAARAIDQRMRQAGRQVLSAAGELAPRSRGTLSLIATLLFYVVGLTGVWFFAVTGAFWFLSIFVVAMFAVAHWLKRLYQSSALPTAVAGVEKPVVWLADLPLDLYQNTLTALRSLQGVRMPLMIAALCSFVLGVALVFPAVMENDDLFIGAGCALLAGFVLTRFAIPRDVLVQTTEQRLVTFAPVLPVLIPGGFIFLIWPVIAWLALGFGSPLPTWFSNWSGIDQALEEVSSVGTVLAHLFGALTVEMLWLTGVATVNALFPGATRWVARPVLDGWSGRWRWRIAICCFVGFAIASLALSVVSGV